MPEIVLIATGRNGVSKMHKPDESDTPDSLCACSGQYRRVERGKVEANREECELCFTDRVDRSKGAANRSHLTALQNADSEVLADD